MDATLQALGGILLKAIPTIFLLAVVFFYLRWMFFGPLEKILAQRAEATSGALKEAEAFRVKVREKESAIEEALRKAREQIYQEQEASRRQWVGDQTAQLEQARLHSRELIQQARQNLSEESERARRDLAETAGSLADQVAQRLLEREPA